MKGQISESEEYPIPLPIVWTHHPVVASRIAENKLLAQPFTVAQGLIHGLSWTQSTVGSRVPTVDLDYPHLNLALTKCHLGLTVVQTAILRYVSTATQTDPLDLRVLAEIPSSPPAFSEERFNLVPLEFCNSNLVSLRRVHLDNARECLANLPEPYEILPLRVVREEQAECEVRESAEPKTPEAQPGTSGVPSPPKTPVVSVPDKSPSCPCCADQFNWMLGLIEHLKRAHGQITGTILDALRDCRTVLIPKSLSEEKLGDISNWRPITIALVVFQLFSRIANARLLRGDPMSPLLFNLALDPLLCKLEAEGKGFHRGGFRITTMAFADHLVLVSDSWEGMCHNIKILETFCDLTGLQTQVTQDTRIKRHSSICETLSNEAKRENWTVYQEPHLRDDKNELYKPDLILVKGNKAFVVDVTVRYEHNNLSLKEAATEKAKKYQGLLLQMKELTNTEAVEFVGFPLGARGKWFEKNSKLLLALGLSKARLGRVARALASRVLFSSMDIVHIFASKICSLLPDNK
ncbi:hypothetical protein HGM15179_003202 [Zosterops borbonicus]|uniref:C2H2-type domain-containing protein n=1 Tax=Zosterops borbonicus TaxID=364589 RepID=A0A8K1GRI9_9PASS|nr:hypothetical protein HGM15179_003202 [Zosterops borbonicus]